MKAAKRLTETFCFECGRRSLFEGSERKSCLNCFSKGGRSSECSNCGMFHMGVSALCGLCESRTEDFSVFESSCSELELSEDEVKIQDEELRYEVLDILRNYFTFPNPTTSNALSALQIIDSQLLDGQICPVCFESFRINEEAVALPCQHFYHYSCIHKWLQHTDSCPVCRHIIH